jgi:hypothetical protein
MGGGAPRKISFFGRDKIGDQSPAPADQTAPAEAASLPSDELNAHISPAPDSPAPDSPGDGSPSYGRPRAVDGVHPERLPAPDSPAPDSPAPDSIIVNLWSSLPKTDGHLKMPNVIIDHLYQFLDLQERSVYEQLFRLSHGYGKSTCTIGYPKLAARAGMGRTATIQTVERLIVKGLVARIGKDVGGRKLQGSTYWVSAPGSPGANSPGAEPNKEKVLKENSKREGGSHQKRNYSDCPDCRGVGMWYPNGFGKGVAKCRHTKLLGR